MGLYDRDYYRVPRRSNRRGRGGIGRLGLWSITTWLILINTCVYLIDYFLRSRIATAIGQPIADVSPVAPGTLEYLGFFSIDTAIKHLQAWRVITCQFLHVSFLHLAMNMLGLWIFGGLVENRMGRRRFTFFYILCGIAGPVMYTILWRISYLIPMNFLPTSDTKMVGASAGIFGIMLAAAYLEPDRRIYVYFFDISLKYFAWIMVGIAAYTVIANGYNAGGQAAHIGGALLGYILIRHDSALNLVGERQQVWRPKPGKVWMRNKNR
jgi:membrane associated rhomboid family serine protease